MTTEEYQEAAQRLRPVLLTTARRYLASGEEAEDIVQDVLVKLWLMRDTLRPPIDGMAKILTRNLCIDQLRRRHPTTDVTLLEAVDDEDNQEQLEQVLRIVDTLPDTQKTIIRLRHIEGMEMREIAALTGASEVSVRKTLSRARSAVRQRYLRAFAAASVIIAMVAAGVWLFDSRRQESEEYVAIIYGHRSTDRQVVISEMRKAVGDLPNAEANVDAQLQDMFNIE